MSVDSPPETAPAALEPELFDAAKVLAPFTGSDGPAGEDLLFSPVYNQLAEYVREDDPKAAGGDAFKPKEGWKLGNWRAAEAEATQLLVERSKDLRVAGYLSRALAKRAGLRGLAEGMWLLTELLDRYWEDLRPLPDRIRVGQERLLDPGPRALDLAVAFRGFIDVIEGLNPCDESLSASALTDALPAAEALAEEHRRLAALIDARFRGPYDALPRLASAVSAYVEPFRALARAKAEELRAAEAEAERRRLQAEADAVRAAEDEARRLVEAEEQRAQLAALGIGGDAIAAPQPAGASAGSSRSRAFVGCAGLAATVLGTDPADADALRLVLLSQWDPRVRSEGTTPVPEAARSVAARLWSQSDWPTLVGLVVMAWGQPWGRDWLDLPFYHRALIADRGDAAAEAVSLLDASVRERLQQEPDWPSRQFADGTPCAEAPAREWAVSILQAEREAKETELGAGGLTAAEVAAAEALAEDGKLGAAVGLLQSAVDASPSSRDRFVRRLDLAGFLVGRSRHDLAGPLFLAARGQAEERELESWERAGLIARIHEGLYHCAQAGSTDCADLAEASMRHLSLLDPLRAMKARGE